MKSCMIYLVYIDDKKFAGSNTKSIEEEIKGIGIQQDKQRH